MATTKTLDEAIKESRVYRAQRFPLLDLSDNIKELRDIAEAAQPYVQEMNVELCKPEPWEFVVKATMEVLSATFSYLNKRKTKDFKEVFIDFGTLMTISIAYSETKQADKNGTFNPSIRIGKDLAYEFREEPYYSDAMSNDMAEDLREMGIPFMHPMFYTVREQMKQICDSAAASLMAKYSCKIPDTETLSYVVVAFFRKAKEYLIEHKDDGEDGVEFAVGRLITMGIEKQKNGEYFIYITPGQVFKMDNAKGDEITELE